MLVRMCGQNVSPKSNALDSRFDLKKLRGKTLVVYYRSLAPNPTTHYPALMDVPASQRITELRQQIERIREANAVYRSQKNRSYQDKVGALRPK